MQRFPDWAARLEIWLFEQKDRRFQYGSWDCCLFVCEAIREMTGIDPGAEFRGEYDSAVDAAMLMRLRYDARSLGAMVEAVAARQGMREVPVQHAKRGDVMLIKRPKDASLGLLALDGSRVIVLAGSRGMRTIPRFAAARAWAV
jgi:hypothetical protein